MPIKYRRNYRLLVDTLNASIVGPRVPTNNPLDSVNSLEITPPITLEFNIVRQNLASVNEAQFTLYNLNVGKRTLIRKDIWQTDVYRPVELWAGYGDALPAAIEQINNPNLSNLSRQNFPRIFRGNVTRAYSYRNGVDFLTKLECQDAGWAGVNADFNSTYAAGTPIFQIIEDLIASMPTIRIGAIGSFPGTLARSMAIAGNPKDILVQLTRGNFWIDNERAFCLGPNEYLAATTVPVLDDSHGIIGVPQKQTTLVTMDLLFEPGLFVNQKVELRTRTVPYYNGLYVVKGITHKGIISESVCGSAITSLILDNLDPAARLVAQQ